ncbi:MAG TPA: DoxX family protein [Steroidobacteraceae bacterium]|nr:DoxX family protein [Steroidobacteraceae bacterium]
MSTLLWVCQGFLALFFASASLQQLFNFEKLARQYPIYRAVPRRLWIGYAVVSLSCAVGLVLTDVWPLVTPIAALILAVQGLAFAALYAYHAGFRPTFVMWSLWTLGPVALATFIAYARFSAIAGK